MNIASIISLVIAAFSLLFAVYSGIANLKRNNKTDTTAEVSQTVSVMTKLEYISSGISDIKNEIGNVKTEVQGLRDRVVAGEESIKQAHKRIDEIVHRLDLNHE